MILHSVKQPINKGVVHSDDKYIVAYAIGVNTYQAVEGHRGTDRAEWARNILQTHDREKAGFKDRTYAVLNIEDVEWQDGYKPKSRW